MTKDNVRNLTRFVSVLSVLASAVVAQAQDGTVTAIAGLTAEGPLASAVSPGGWSAQRADGSPAADFWPARALTRIEEGVFVGVVRLRAEGLDVRGRSIPPGTYTLRFTTIPVSDRHGRCLQNPDFLVLLPATDDAEPDVRLSYHEMTTLSAHILGQRHPAVWQTQRGRTAPAAARLSIDTTGNEILSVPLDVAGARLGLSVFLRGSLVR